MTGPRSEPPMPMFTTVATRLSVTPVQEPSRTAVAKSKTFFRTACTSSSMFCPSTSSGAGGSRAPAPGSPAGGRGGRTAPRAGQPGRGAAERRVQDGAVLRDVDVLAGDHRLVAALDVDLLR